MSRVLVTGGGTGIGRGIAEVLVSAGEQVIITGRRAAVLEQAAQEIGATPLVWDVTDDPGGLIAAAGPLDHLVHNAGHYIHGGIDDFSADAFGSLYAVHVVAPALLSRAFVAARGDGGGDASIVFISSTLAERPAPGTAAYGAAKAAMVSLSRSLAQELAPRGVRANAVLPGVVPTAMSDAPRGDLDPDAYRALVTGLTPLGRLGRPEEVGHAVQYLLRSTWVTGASIAVDGGMLIS